MLILLPEKPDGLAGLEAEINAEPIHIRLQKNTQSFTES